MSSEYRLRTTYWKESTQEIRLTPLTRNALLQHRSKQCQLDLHLELTLLLLKKKLSFLAFTL